MHTPNHRYLVDASIYIFRAYFSLPEDWHSPEGYPLNAVYGYTRFLVELLTTNRIRHIGVAFDNSLGSGFRHELYPQYKHRRELPDEALAFQLDACEQMTRLMGIACFASSRYEADDLIATLAAKGREQGQPACIITRDKDLGQLLEEHDVWWDYASRVQHGEAEFEQRFGVPPERFADYLALVGDAVDDIPGVPGVGPKAALALMQHFDSLEDIFSRCGEVENLPIRGAKKLAARLPDHEADVHLYRELTGLVTDIQLQDVDCEHHFDEAAYETLQEYLSNIGLEGLAVYCRRLRGLYQEIEPWPGE